jgi:hypothetical protein
MPPLVEGIYFTGSSAPLVIRTGKNPERFMVGFGLYLLSAPSAAVAVK